MVQTKALALVCPYCGLGKIDAQLETVWTGYGPSEHADKQITGFKCKRSVCGAEWNKEGTPTLGPRAQLEQVRITRD